ncbi:peptide chain release factor 1 [Thomasclavelia cocleata]|uniref:Peptide chain release factor 1 n=1 Tax=Thomasclavelia cocleata TaxID=69824 RepID=A0A1I0F4Z4_9FIRM|nr:peptide chain release factor 1 [Thomasclavelia cocleata]MCR1960699.1 peptide chain release factor 1 [Thomasclavelia cocleata]NDO41371.1 peptide chain release factor 1 [Thomasclavelia cocleata]PJN81755.1 peptide chain release factor 1 [Thomasclavelia cocleata]SET52747.1 peptide chain release factor 1 [Thomasclavelia cocleata]
MNESMLDRLKTMENRYEELGHMLMDPDIGSDIKKMTEVTKEQASLQTAYDLYQEYKEIEAGIEDAKELAKESDPEIKEMAKLELAELEEKFPEIIKKLEIELVPKDPNDNKDVIMEIRGAAGGDEGNIFAGDLYRMYVKYSESQGWKVEVMEAIDAEAGGYSLISFMVKGEGVYGKLKFESGSHRVQRVPKTETQGRVHTSTATVLVMPEVEEVDVEINKNDLRIDTYRASGAGGQHINKTDSAVRITHIPTGIVAASQDGRSQHDNKDKAMKALIARIYDYYQQQQDEQVGNERKSKVGSGDRAEKIRTYNYPQNRVTDHRIGLTIQQLDRIIEGKLDDIITALINEDQRLKMEGQH